ncbi:MAG: ABC transporter ATP-binding protein, partial [Pedosphaera parvula]|nr:ABC transporter ATP-binding protein [Pedosphaera parvula]
VQQVAGVLILLPLLMALRGFLGYFSSYFMGWVSERAINDMRLDVLIKLNSLSLDFFNRSTMGDLMTRVNGDTAALHRAMNFGFSDLIKEPITMIGVIGLLCYLDWKLTLVVLVVFPVCMVPLIILGKKVRRASRGTVTAGISQGSLLVELLSSIRIVKAFNLEDQQVEHYRKLSRDLVHHGMKSIQARELVNPIIETIGAVGFGVLIVWIFHTGRSLADMVIFLGGVMMIYPSIKKLAALHVLFQQTSVGVERLVNILREQPSVKEAPQPRPIERFERNVVFENVSFSYGHELVLSNVNLAVPRGFKLGVAGESGSGKSTMVNLMFRFYDPTQGVIKIDGRDLREFSFHSLRQVLALVSQEVVLFDQTVAEN